MQFQDLLTQWQTSKTIYVGVRNMLFVLLTGASAVVLCVLLRMPPQPALETVLPELRKPGVPQVGIGRQLQVIIIKPGHVS